VVDQSFVLDKLNDLSVSEALVPLQTVLYVVDGPHHLHLGVLGGEDELRVQKLDGGESATLTLHLDNKIFLVKLGLPNSCFLVAHDVGFEEFHEASLRDRDLLLCLDDALQLRVYYIFFLVFVAEVENVLAEDLRVSRFNVLRVQLLGRR